MVLLKKLKLFGGYVLEKWIRIILSKNIDLNKYFNELKNGLEVGFNIDELYEYINSKIS